MSGPHGNGAVRGPHGGGRGSVLLVEDDPDTAAMYQLGLEHLGFEVAVSPDGPSLFRAVESWLPDIVVLDWQLPGWFGDEVLRRMRRDSRLASVPVFILSNFPSIKDGAIDRVFADGALAWLEKVSTPPDVLAEKLSEALVARQQQPR